MRTACVIAALAACVAVSTSAAEAQTRLTKIQLVTKQTSLRPTDKPPQGPSPGDSAVETSRLLNEVPQWGRPKGAVVGRDRATFRIGAGQTVTVEGVAFIPGGTLVLRGRLRPDGRGGLVAPVVGGTGSYARARGSIRVSVASNPRRTLNTYTLRYGS